MLIELKKFGQTLTSRDDGREALAAFKPSLNAISPGEAVEISFEGVNTLSPSWADEFIIVLAKMFPGKLRLRKDINPSVTATMSMLGDIHKLDFMWI